MADSNITGLPLRSTDPTGGLAYGGYDGDANPDQAVNIGGNFGLAVNDGSGVPVGALASMTAQAGTVVGWNFGGTYTNVPYSQDTTGDHLVMRDINGRFQVPAPNDGLDTSNKNYVDAQITVLSDSTAQIGGNSVSATMDIGTTTAQDVRILRNNVAGATFGDGTVTLSGELFVSDGTVEFHVRNGQVEGGPAYVPSQAKSLVPKDYADAIKGNIGAPVHHTASVVLTATDAQLNTFDATAGSITVTLPGSAESTASGKVFTMKRTDASANSVTIQGDTGVTVDGATAGLPNQWDVVTVAFDGSNWLIIA